MSARSILLLAVLVAFCAELPLSSCASWVNTPDSRTTIVLPIIEKSVKLRWEWSLSGSEQTNQATIKRYNNQDKANTEKDIAVLLGITGKASTPEPGYFIAAGNVGNAGSINGYLELTIKDVLNQGNNKNGDKADVMTANYTYECKVQIVGSSIRTLDKYTKLFVFEKPTIKTAPEDKDITSLNTNASFTCVARGKLAPTIIWSRLLMSGSQEIATGLDTQVSGLETTSKYTEKNFQATDVGIYTCKASNGVGSISADAIVQYTTCDVGCVTDDQIAIEITNLTYTSDYENNNSNKYIGLKKAIEKECFNVYARAIQNVYSCKVRGFWPGSVIANIKITYKSDTDKPRQPLLDAIKDGTFAGYPVKKELVNEKPTITRTPDDKDITCLNTETSFTCVARGKFAPAIITWSRVSMSGISQITIGVQTQVNGLVTTSKYTKKNFQASDVGVYTCKASNRVDSASADAIVQYTTCDVGCVTDDQIAIEMTNLTYTSDYENVNSNKYIGLKKAIEKECLTVYVKAIQNVYSCKVRGFSWSGRVIANVKITYHSRIAKPRQPLLDAIKTGIFAGYPVKKELVSGTLRPTIKRSPVDNYITNKDREIYSICVAEGTPAPTVTWSRTSLTSGVSSLSGVSKLDGLNRTIGMYTISSFKDSDIGIYNCTATNKAGSVSAVVIAQYIECDEGCSTDDKIAIEMTDLTYSSDYESEHSEKYKELKHAIERECFAVYARATQNIFSCIVKGFRPGSVISHIRMTYPSDTNEPRKPLQTAIKSGKFTGHTVRTSFVSSKASRASASVFLFTIFPVKSSAAIMFIQGVASVIMMHLMGG